MSFNCILRDFLGVSKNNNAGPYLHCALAILRECKLLWFRVISDFRHEADDTCALLSPDTEEEFGVSCALKMGPISYPETSVRNYQYILRNIPEERKFLLCFQLTHIDEFVAYVFQYVRIRS